MDAEFGAAHLSRGIARLSSEVLAEGRGSYVFTTENRKLLDMTCGIGVVNLGHCHPGVTRAAQEQCGKITHAQLNMGYSKPMLELIKELLTIMPDPKLDTFFFWNSGAEAVEASIKVARSVTRRQNVIVMQGSYHGRTLATAGMTRSKTLYGVNQGPLVPGVFSTAFPYYSHFGASPDTPEEELTRVSLDRLRLLLKQETAPEDTAAIIVETALGEGGYVPAPHAFLHGVREICSKHGILMISDEVQTGFGRTGKMFAVEHSGVTPDMMVFAKGLANGFPLSGIVSRKEIMDKCIPGTLGGTYAGNAVSCAAARAVVQAFREEGVLDNVAARSKQLTDGLEKLRSSAPAGKYIEQIRGLGLMIGVQLRTPEDKPLAGKLTQACLRHGMLLLSTSSFDVVRWIPPLNVSASELDEGLRIFEAALTDAAKEQSLI